jgi:uncharacterized coiled-coil DUF342 family protein
MQLFIQQKRIEIQKFFTYIQGSFDLDRVSIDNIPIPRILFNWSNFFPTILSNPEMLTAFLLWDPEHSVEKFVPNPQLFSEISHFIELKKIISQLSEKFLDLKNQLANYEQRESLNKTLENLDDQRKMLLEINQNSVLQSKQDLLSKITMELQEIENKLTLIADEYRVVKNRMQQFSDRKSQLEHSIEELTQNQKSNYNQTNRLTKEIDDLESQVENYEEKLINLANDPQNPDYLRISGKLDDVRKNLQQLKAQKLQFMQESKTIQIKLTGLQRDLKELKQKIAKENPDTNEITNRYEQLQQQRQRQLEKAEAIRQELGNYNSETTSQKPGIKLTYSSVYQIDEAIKNVQQKLSILNRNMQLIDLHLVTTQIQQTRDQLQKIKTELDLFQNHSQLDFQIAVFLQRARQFCSQLNKILQLVDLQFNFEIKNAVDNSPPGQSFILSTNIIQKGKEISIENDINRNQRTILYLAVIFCLAHIWERKFICINTEQLPEVICTKKTITKGLTTLKEFLESNPDYGFEKIVILDPKKILELTPDFNLEEE